MRGRILAGAVTVLLAGCGGSATPSASGTSSFTAAASTAAAPTATASTGTGGSSSLPLGDGLTSRSAQSGHINACPGGPPGDGGAQFDGPWIHGSTWDPGAKVHVQGDVSWPAASYSVQVQGSQRVITTNDLPTGHGTGVFPIASSDPSYAYDRNPNSISAQSITYRLPVQPAVASSASCLSMGPIGVLSDGVLLYNGFDAEQRDAVAHEVLDSCDGHPDQSGSYHHHDIPACLLAKATGTSTLVGYALDGFGIYVERDSSGNLLTDADLDACHGRTSTVTWDGAQVSLYHYVATAEFPYTLGCFRGTAVSSRG